MPMTPRQRIWRSRFETVIGLMSPVLDLMLNAGDRVSRALSGEDGEYYPIRSAPEAVELEEPRGEAKKHAVETGD
jgi:hypothetical protein